MKKLDHHIIGLTSRLRNCPIDCVAVRCSAYSYLL